MMRFQIGDILKTSSEPEPNGWERIVSPSSKLIVVYSWIIGIAMLTALLAVVIGSSMIFPRPSTDFDPEQVTPWLVVLLTAAISVPLHELLHALFHPRFGLSDATVLVAWPRKLRFGVYYEGRMSRRRWLAMRLSPLIFLSFAPVLLLASQNGSWHSFEIETILSVLLLVNALGSGSDVLGAGWVLKNIPGGSELGFWGGRAYWKQS